VFCVSVGPSVGKKRATRPRLDALENFLLERYDAPKVLRKKAVDLGILFVGLFIF
jgi:hypothetical protein